MIGKREREGDMRATNLERERGPVRFPLWHGRWMRGRGISEREGGRG